MKKWLVNLLTRAHRERRPAPALSTFRPCLEALEDRNLMNVSTVFDAAGNRTVLVVAQDGSLVEYTSSTGFNPMVLTTSGIRVAHAFLDSTGAPAFDIIYSSGQAFEYDSTGGHFIGDHILDMSRVVDRHGNFKLDVLSTTASPPYHPDLTGTLFEYTSTSATMLSTNARWVSNYVDPNGGLGIAVGLITGGNLVAFRQDSTGSFLLYNAPDGATQDITDYGQTTDPITGAIWSVVTHGRFAGTYAIESRPTGAVTIGNGADILVGG
jgi:hypothetical protein